MKCTHQYTDSTLSTSTRSPPSKRSATIPDTILPNYDNLREALKYGGAADVDAKKVLTSITYQIDFYPIPTTPFMDILEQLSKDAFSIDTSDFYHGQLQLGQLSSTLIGVGAFKTAQSAILVISQATATGLGSQLQQDVVIKCSYLH
ncbi:hypothetical protein ID866_11910 [Astraeus odoratus]|nr:hypothetical protein ID866_11910 [Astraeus odoratus]